MQLMGQGLYSKARRRILANGCGDLSVPAIVAEMRLKHPQNRLDYPGFLPEELANRDDSARLTFKLGKRYRALKRHKAPGPDGFRSEFLIALTYKFNCPLASRALEAHEYMGMLYAKAELPAWYYHVAQAVELAALVKKPAKPPPNPAPAAHRPLGMGGIRRNTFIGAAVHKYKDEMAKELGVTQVAIGRSAGVQILYTGIRIHLEENPTHVCAGLDSANAFNLQE